MSVKWWGSLKCLFTLYSFKNFRKFALAGVAQWIECELQTKLRQFNSQSGHMPGLQARTPVGCV